MNARFIQIGLLALLPALAGCATKKPYDYTSFRAHPPRSVLVLPPLSQSTDIRATYSCLSTITAPLAELGYYVFPVVVVDHFMKENGLPTAGEMHQAPLDKIRDVFGADAVLYLNIKQYGSKYELISSVTTVTLEGKLVDVKTGLLLWEGSATLQQSSSSGNLLVDLIATPFQQAYNSSTDQARNVAAGVNLQLLCTKDHGLLYGPYFPADNQH